MKRTQFWLIVFSFHSFLITPAFSQNHTLEVSKDSPLVIFEQAIADGFIPPAPDGKYLSNKSYEWMKQWMPDFKQQRFDSESWSKIKQEFKVGVELPIATVAFLRVFNSDGILISEEQHNLVRGTHRFPIDAKNWDKGGYIVQLQTDFGGILKKVIKL